MQFYRNEPENIEVWEYLLGCSVVSSIRSTLRVTCKVKMFKLQPRGLKINKSLTQWHDLRNIKVFKERSLTLYSSINELTASFKSSCSILN